MMPIEQFVMNTRQLVVLWDGYSAGIPPGVLFSAFVIMALATRRAPAVRSRPVPEEWSSTVPERETSA
ncbi:hypothetical protein [Pseudonocardia alaniniphila]|uniref:Uncharacterized protein n=1 Tax=Pseudonocardia alaniniphila TaxID=75291 RepID=A0ABS9TTW3_9PSEU|nr:hypothetical protein [Pseudonocardia alaniniphila]MCH6171964.1 hypothetical protein [Pseudonocardia alaniniphila]